jgi:FixJ family two-component response regulator
MTSHCVHIIDDDDSLCRSMCRLVRTFNYTVQTYASASEFLSQERDGRPACLVLDLRMPEIDGLELQEILSRDERYLTIILMSGGGDVETSVKAMKAGAIDFLSKPFDDTQLLSAIRNALSRSEQILEKQKQSRKDLAAFHSLTTRERQVCIGIALGLLNKQVAFELGTAEKTVKAQRAHVMQKLEAESLPDIVRLVERLKIEGVLPVTQSPIRLLPS